MRAVPKRHFYWLCIIAGLLLVPVGGPGAYAGLCADGRPGCPDYQQEPQYALPAHANYAGAAPPRHYEPAAQETLPPCDEKQYAAYSFQRFEPKPYEAPEPYHPYDAETVKEWCGIGCWYRRLTSGYCGRGCDYYFYRLNKFPEGTLPKYNQKKLACR
jgi:hypothetical protein